MSAELRQLRERCDAFDALADALRTPDGWLSYRAMALRDQLHESARQDPAHPSTLEQFCTALIDRDEALRQARADLEKTRTLRPTGRRRWPASATTTWSSTRCSWGRRLSRARLRSGHARSSRRPRRPTI
jgi:hypothetical protein